MSHYQEAKGFTLIELAIGLAIIGILITAIIKGSELINNSKAKRVLNDLKGIEAAILTYYDRMGKFPGDCDRDGAIEYVLEQVANPTTLINSYSRFSYPTYDYCVTTATPENDPNLSWSDMKVGRVLPLNTYNRDLARHPFSHFFAIGVRRNPWGPVAPFYNAIAIYGLPAWVGKMLDSAIDGAPDGQVGRLRCYAYGTISGSGNFYSWPTNEEEKVAVIYFFDKTP